MQDKAWLDGQKNGRIDRLGGPKMNKPGSCYSMRDIPATTPWDTATVGHVPMRVLFNNRIQLTLLMQRSISSHPGF